MALVVETGDGLTNAESYISLADAEARATSLGTTWDGDDAAKEQALRRATEYMTQAYRGRWKGTRLTRAQALDWPRYGVVLEGVYYTESNTVPAEVANACADLAIRASTADLNADQGRVAIREKVGPLESEYSPYASQTKQYRAIDMMLAPYLKGGSGMASLVRA